jgi:hypothetical protein
MKDCVVGKNNINICHVTERKKSVVGSGFELGPSHARRMGTKRSNTLNTELTTTAKPSDAVLYIQCELKPLPEKHF